MTVQNTEVSDDKTEELNKEKENEGDKALDFAAQLERGEIKLEDVPEEHQKEIHERFIVNKEEIPEPGAETASAEKPDESKEEPLSPAEEKPAAEKPIEKPAENLSDEDKATFLRERKERLDELNTIDQRIKASEEKLSKIGEIPKKPEKKNYDELTEDEGVKTVLKRQDDIETRQNEDLTEKKGALETELQAIKQEKMYLELSTLQHEDGSLKTSKPVQTLNKQYGAFVKSVGGLDNVDKFLNDNVFREQIEAKGIAFPMSPEDYEKFDTISKINAFKIKGKYPSFSSAYYDYQKELGIVPDAVTKAALKATEDVLEKVGGGEGGATTLSPGDGGGPQTEVEQTPAEMQAWLVKHPNPKTPEDIAMAEKIHKKVTGGRA